MRTRNSNLAPGQQIGTLTVVEILPGTLGATHRRVRMLCTCGAVEEIWNDRVNSMRRKVATNPAYRPTCTQCAMVDQMQRDQRAVRVEAEVQEVMPPQRAHAYRTWKVLMARGVRHARNEYPRGINYYALDLKDPLAIYIDRRWDDFSEFLWDVGLPTAETDVLIRRDVCGPYVRGNAVWGTRRDLAALVFSPDGRRGDRLGQSWVWCVTGSGSEDEALCKIPYSLVQDTRLDPYLYPRNGRTMPGEMVDTSHIGRPFIRA